MPAATRTTEPLAEDRTRHHDPRLVRLERANEPARLTGRPHQEADQRGQQVRGNSQSRALGNVVDLADHFEAAARPDDPGENLGEGTAGSLKRRRDQPRGDDASLDEPQVIVAKIEQFFKRIYVLACFEIDAGESQDRFGQDAAVGFDGRNRMRVTAEQPEVDRDVQDTGSLGVIHAEEEDVGPGGMGQVEPNGRPLDQHGKELAGPSAPEQSRMNSDGMLVGLPDAKHPAIARAASDRASHLVGECLVGDLFVGVSQGAEDCAVDAAGPHGAEKRGDRLLETSGKQILESVEGNPSGRGHAWCVLDHESEDRMQEHRSAHALIEVLRAPTKRLQFLARGQDLGNREPLDQLADRLVANRGVGAPDGGDQRIRICRAGHVLGSRVGSAGPPA